MSDAKARLTEAAEHLDWLYEGAKHLPSDLVHDRDFRMGLVRSENRSVAQFFYGGAAEVFMTLGPDVLPLLSTLLRSEAGRITPTYGSVQLADHIIATKETTRHV